MPRPIAIRNAHPRLTVPRAAVARAIALLDEHFQILPADLPHLVLPAARRSALKSIARPGLSAASRRASPRSALRIPQSAVPAGELSLVFLTDPALAQVHADFMDDPTATDVITFEGNTAAGLAGEICVSADTAAKFVGLPLAGRPGSVEGLRARGRALGEPRHNAFARELTLYLVHGWLHLAGYDDLRPARKRRMRAAEARAMKLLTAADAIPPFRLRAATASRR
jgi:probable rRNA maturation factor